MITSLYLGMICGVLFYNLEHSKTTHTFEVFPFKKRFKNNSWLRLCIVEWFMLFLLLIWPPTGVPFTNCQETKRNVILCPQNHAQPLSFRYRKSASNLDFKMWWVIFWPLSLYVCSEILKVKYERLSRDNAIVAFLLGFICWNGHSVSKKQRQWSKWWWQEHRGSKRQYRQRLGSKQQWWEHRRSKRQWKEHRRSKWQWQEHLGSKQRWQEHRGSNQVKRQLRESNM